MIPIDGANVKRAGELNEAEAREDLARYHDDMALLFWGKDAVASAWHRARAARLRNGGPQ